MRKPKLSIELIPRSSWGVNARSELSTFEWEMLRKNCYKRADYKCEVCGDVGEQHPVEAHEVWRFDERREVQRLVRLIALCPKCHAVKHWGRSCLLGFRVDCEKHILSVNKWKPYQLAQYLQKVAVTQDRRGPIKWRVSLSCLKQELKALKDIDVWLDSVS